MAPSDYSIAPVVKIWNPPPNHRVIEAARKVDAESAAKSREKAMRLLRDERVIASGPVMKQHLIYIPSPCWQPKFVDECNQHGGRFKRCDGRLFDVWIIPIHRMTIEQARALYVEYFFREIAMSRNNLNVVGVDYAAI